MTAVNALGGDLNTRVDIIATYEVNPAGKITRMQADGSWDALHEQLEHMGLA